MNYHVVLRLKRLLCHTTESIHSSDKFALTGAIATDEDNVGIYFPVRRINNGEIWEINQEYSLTADKPQVQISLLGFDIDDNDSWKENSAEIKAIVQGISTIVGAINSAAGGVGGAIGLGVIEAVNAFNKWDKNDKLIDYNNLIHLPSTPAYQKNLIPLTKVFQNSGSLAGSSDFKYTLEFELEHTFMPSFGGGAPAEPTEGEVVLTHFRNRADAASKRGFVGGFPNFHFGRNGMSYVGGTIFLTSRAAEARNIPWAELKLGNRSLNDFNDRMRATQTWAVSRGYVGGFPTGYPQPAGDICHTILLGSDAAEHRYIPLSEMSLKNLDNAQEAFRRVHNWAVKRGYIGGFPTMSHIDVPFTDMPYFPGILNDVGWPIKPDLLQQSVRSYLAEGSVSTDFIQGPLGRDPMEGPLGRDPMEGPLGRDPMEGPLKPIIPDGFPVLPDQVHYPTVLKRLAGAILIKPSAGHREDIVLFTNPS